jgi:two-component system, NtrC family, sensor histidine kinase HydH
MSETRLRPLTVKQLSFGALATGAMMISGVHHFTGPEHIHWLNVFQVLYYIPTVLGALLFGWRAGLAVAMVAALSHSPYIVQAARGSSGYAAEQTVEMLLLCGVGLLTGILSDRDRKQRRELERTTRELSDVYRELQKNFEQMKRAERLFAVGQLAAGLAHEIRNPLCSVAGAAGILQRNARLEPKHQECVEIIQKESQRLNKLLTEFLDFARPRPPKFQSTRVDALLASVIQLAAHAVGRKRVQLRNQPAAGLPLIEVDPEMVKQMLLNLLINAIQATPDEGEVLVAAEAQEGKVFISVRDEGCGIEPEIRDKIFDPFFTTKDGGTGLGLAVAHQIVEQHGGVLKAAANAGRGTTFFVVLPLHHQGVA